MVYGLAITVVQVREEGCTDVILYYMHAALSFLDFSSPITRIHSLGPISLWDIPK